MVTILISTKNIDKSIFFKIEDLPQGATVPALGLTNKPVFEQMKKEGYIVDDDYPDLYFSPIHLKSKCYVCSFNVYYNL